MQLIARALAVASAMLVIAGVAARVSADEGTPRAEAALSVYVDDDAVTVVSPAASGRVALEGVQIQADVNLDVVTAASIDVVSQASGRTMHERRLEGGLAASVAPFARAPDLSLDARVLGSTENDYDALTLGAGLRYDAFEHRVSLALSYVAGLDDVGRVGDPTFERSRSAHRLIASSTLVLDERTVLDVVLDGSFVQGYQASPYRYVPIFGAGADGQRLYSLPERLPDERWTGAVVLRLRRALGTPPRVFVHADYRFYVDDWAIHSHTAGALGLVTLFDQRLTLSLGVRVYAQRAAALYERRYVDTGSGAPALRTRDRVLGGMYSIGGTLGAELAIGELASDPTLRLFGHAEVTRFRWLDFSLQEGRTALVLTVGATAPL